MTDELTDLRELLARAVVVLDSLDDIDTISEIGAPSDDLYSAVLDLDRIDSLVAMGGHRARYMDLVGGLSDRDSRMLWLQRSAGLAPEQALMVSELDAGEVRVYLSCMDDVLVMREQRLVAARAAAVELAPLLDAHQSRVGAVTTPDTVPSGW